MGSRKINIARMSAAARARALGLPPQDDGSGEEFRRGIFDREEGLPEDPEGSLSYRRGYRSSIRLAGTRSEREARRAAIQEALQAEANRPTREERLRQLFRILKQAAVEHAPCPTNDWLARQMGYTSHGSVVPMLHELVEMEMIAIHRDGGNLRRIEILGMGIETAVSSPMMRKNENEKDET